MAKFKILSIDGGGLRGIIPVLILQEVERRTGKRITDLFDLIAGTSTGGLIACGLTVSDDGKTPLYNLQQLEHIYTKNGKDIFPQANFFKGLIMKLTALKSPKYSANGLQTVLQNLLGSRPITQCITPIFVSTYDLNNNEAILFKSRHALNFPENNVSLVDVCRATSAAPTYLPAYDFIYQNKPRVCIDGGMYMNNPTVGAIIEVLKYGNEAPYNVQGIKLNDIQVLSLGTGHYSSDISKHKVESWGQLDWAAKITDVMLQAVNQTTNYEAQELIADANFLRINPDITNPDFAQMDDSSDQAMQYFASLVNNLFKDDAFNKSLNTFLQILDSPLA